MSQAKPKPKSPFQPKPALPTPERLKKLHAGLVDQINEGYLDNAVKTCRKILTLDPTSLSAFKTLLFLLLQTDQYPLALSSFTSYPQITLPGSDANANPEKGFLFEKAYCLYRLHRELEALGLIDKELGGREGYESEEGRKVGHLRGQILYRAGRYEEAEEVYNELLASCPPDSPESPDIQNNLHSTQIQLEFQQSTYLTQLRNSSIDLEALEGELPSLPSSSRAGVLGEEGSRGVGLGKEQGEEKGGKKRRRNRLPKGVEEGVGGDEDPDRWLPLPLRRSYQATLASQPTLGKKKKQTGGKQVSGIGMQGSTNEDKQAAGGGGKGKKGKKGR